MHLLHLFACPVLRSPNMAAATPVEVAAATWAAASVEEDSMAVVAMAEVLVASMVGTAAELMAAVITVAVIPEAMQVEADTAAHIQAEAQAHPDHGPGKAKARRGTRRPAGTDSPEITAQ